ncbi:MAG TPA: hypothetical protein VFW71_04800 [Actinomycetota bacterium]|nr:hypothetical protein [Actinomycetota bacterium]
MAALILGATSLLLPVAATAAAPSAAPSPLPGPDANPLPAPLGVASGILVDPTNGKVLWSQDDTVARAPASLTKIATALTVLRRANVGAVGTVTNDAVNVGGSELGPPAGTTMTVGDMLWGLLMVSGNDMALALAHTLSPDGTVAGFVGLMNSDAATAGATGSTFVNPHGLDAPGHQSTARDLALLTMEAMRYPLFAQIVATRQHVLVWGGGAHLLTNHNKMLAQFPGTIGVKTGYTSESGSALVSEVTRDGQTLLAVVLGAHTPAGYKDSEALYNWGFTNLGTLEAQATDTITPTPLPAIPLPRPAAAPARAAVNPGQADAATPSRPVPAAQPVGHPTGTLDDVLLAALAISFLAAMVVTRRAGAEVG